MYPTPILWFEITAAILVALGFLWVQVEWALFLYAFALGFPDVVYPLGTTANIRIEDALIVVFLARVIIWTPVPPPRMQRTILTWQSIFLAACLFSIAVETAQQLPPNSFDTAKMAGCAVILAILPLLLQSKRRLQFFVAGLMCAGIALVIQVHQHLADSSPDDYANFQQMKSAAGFTTWNQNTIGQAAVLLAFAAGIGGIGFSRTLTSKIRWSFLAIGFALVPAFVFVRGTTLSIGAAFLLFLCLVRRWRPAAVFAAVCLSLILYLYSQDPRLLKQATTVNLATGEGFSERYDRWGTAIRAIRARPFTGQGFGHEMDYLTLIGGEGRAHNDYLSVWIELGLGGMLGLLAVIFQFVRAGYYLYRNPQFQMHGALLLGLMTALCVANLGLPTLYWEKLPTVTLALAAAVIGLCERGELKIA